MTELWDSPLSAERAAAASGAVSWPAVVGSEVWWCQSVPSAEDADAGVRLRASAVSDPTDSSAPAAPVREVLPDGRGARTRVMEYGGRPWTVDVAPGRATVVVWCDATDQRLWAMTDEQPATARPLTPDGPGLHCYVDPIVVGDEVWAVRERRGDVDDQAVTRDVVAVPLADPGSEVEQPRVVLRAQHFLSSVRVSPDGRRLCWIGWDHPAMPWDGTQLFVADLVDGTAGAARVVLGGPDTSVCQAQWRDDASLYALSDATGWWNLYTVDVTTGAADHVLALQEECGGALWRVGSAWFVVLEDGRVAVVHGVGDTCLSVFDPATGTTGELAAGWREWGGSLSAAGSLVCGVAGAPDRAERVVVVDVSTGQVLRQEDPDAAADDAALDAYRPVPRSVTFPGADGRDVHATLHPPRHPAHTVDGPMPYLVHVHGGPTGRDPLVRDEQIAFFTSRGIGVVACEYGGSTGFGRAYRDRLRGQWGAVDVADTVACARWLAGAGLADPARIAVRGGSAGGWTSLAVAGRSDVFCAHTVYYPISDGLAWQAQTHDFESHYLETLIGPLPDSETLFVERSPASTVGRIRRPVLMLQGLDDVICPPVQAQSAIDVLAANGVEHRYLTFAGERHGFRRASTVAACLTAELTMYTDTMGLSMSLPEEKRTG